MRKNKKKIVGNHAVMLMFYDLVMLGLVSVLLLVFYPSSYYPITRLEALLHYLLAAACMLGARALGNSYNNVWRYGGWAAGCISCCSGCCLCGMWSFSGR